MNIINHVKATHKFDENKISQIISNISKTENKKIDYINFILVDDKYLNKLKKEYFNQDYYTDVISFNLEDKNCPIDGEIYISINRVILNADKYNCSFNNELKRIMIHGLLHLYGYNDITKYEKQNMTNLENKYMNQNPGNIFIN